MDGVSLEFMQEFVRDYVKGTELSICDVGSCDVNGTFKPLFPNHNYIGLDIMEGANVDVVATEMYRYPFEDETFDIVISGSTIEHVKDLHKWITEVARIVKRGGLVCVIGPSLHRNSHFHPYDCWRIMPEGLIFLMKDIAGLEVIYCKRSTRRNTEYIACVGVARKLG